MRKLHLCLLGASLALAAWTSAALGHEAPSSPRQPRALRGVVPSPAPSLLSSYIALVRGHVPGEADIACLAFRNWTDLDVRTASSGFLSLLKAASEARINSVRRAEVAMTAAQFGLEPPELERLDPPVDAKRAVLIHSDVGIGFCGPTFSVEQSNVHFEATQPILQWIGKTDPTSSFPLTWYLAVGGFLTESALWNAGYVLKLGLAAFPDSAQLHLAAGAVDEALTSPDVQREVGERRLQNDVRAMRRFEIAGRGKHLERAAGHYSRALSVDPGLGEARVRLGRVLLEQGRLDEARKELEQARALGGDPFATYHALLFLGRLQQEAGRVALAREACEAAVAQFPDAATPRIALSQLLVELGDREGALATLGPAMPAAGGNSAARRDYWWDYPNGARRQAGQRFEALWQAVMGAGRRHP